MSNQNIITREDLDSFIERLFRETYNNWSDQVTVHGLPKAFDKEALKKLLLKMNEHTFKILSKATGVAYLRNHSIVNQEDCDAATKINSIDIIESVLNDMDGS